MYETFTYVVGMLPLLAWLHWAAWVIIDDYTKERRT